MCAIVRAWNFTILSGSEATYPADEPQDFLDYVALF